MASNAAITIIFIILNAKFGLNDIMKPKVGIYILLLPLIIVSTQIHAQVTAERTAYINKYKKIAIQQMKKTGIPASIILAQACLESANGTSRIAVKANNHFGIKCHDWKGPRIRHNDDKRRECFRKYANAAASFKDHSEFLMSKERYAFLFDYGPDDYRSWAYGLKKAGYATNPEYPKLLIKIIEDNKLYLYDQGEKNPEHVFLTKSPERKAVKSTAEQILKEKHPLYKYTSERNIYENNKTAYIIGKPGDTYKKIARSYRLFKKELLSFNDLKKDADIRPGDIIYLERKKRKAGKDFRSHILKEGETMYGISQKYGIKLKRLYKINGIPENKEPGTNTVLYLR